MTTGQMRYLAVTAIALCPLSTNAQTVTPDAGQLAAPARMEESATQVEDIVVTAQRRSERLQNVPIAISAITASTLAAAGATNTESLSAVVPALDLSRQTNSLTPFLRGVGTSAGQIGNETSIALYLDGVYISSPMAGLFSFNNIERVEVLKGPQGTLFGRNATGGVIQIVTKDPSHDPRADFSFSYGNYNTFGGSLYATTGLTENLAIDIAAYKTRQNDGFGRNLTTGDQTYTSADSGIRSKMIWTPGSRTQIRLSGDYTQSRGETGIGFNFLPGSIGLDGQTTYSGNFYNIAGSPNDQIVTKLAGAALRIDHDMDWATLVSITAFRSMHSEYSFDQDATPARIVDIQVVQDDKMGTQELQLQSPSGGTFQWIVGAFAMKNTAKQDPITISGANNVVQVAKQKTTSLAAFGQGTFEIVSDTRITAGLRYTSDRREVSAAFNNVSQVNPDPVATFNKLTWRLSVDHRFNDDIMVYASYNRGFKSGIFNLQQPTLPPVKPEVLDAYEIGLKSQLFDRMLRFNISSYHYSFSNIQADFNNAGVSILLNAAAARIRGVDLDFELKPTRRLTLRGAAGYIDGKYTSFLNAPSFVLRPTGGATLIAINAAGNQTVRSPKFTGNVGANYAVSMDAGTLDLDVTYSYNSGFFWQFDNVLKQPNHSLLSGALGFTTDVGLGARIWLKNVLDERYYSYARIGGTGSNFSPAAPRTFGVTLSASIR